MTRAFVALTLDDAIRAALGHQIERLRPLSRAVAWVPAQNLHVTLKFLGDQSDRRLADAVEALDEAVEAIAPFDLALRGLGAFPGMERPRIFWVGAAEGVLQVRALQATVDAALQRRGFPADTRPWHPHLTIGRVFDPRRWRRETSPHLREALAHAAATGFGSLPVARVMLMRSDLSPSGARYQELRAADLLTRRGGSAAAPP
ncbi:MAG: RNA 2',3'-cyclic phosphodiesterase [Candidatus Rokuibacteriota bacterium]|nr:MAG: RNA 2',3'-cyclic phosphodiesterase [Candidatus Rokubacteria bacterium]